MEWPAEMEKAKDLKVTELDPLKNGPPQTWGYMAQAAVAGEVSAFPGMPNGCPFKMLNNLQTGTVSNLDIALFSLEFWMYHRSDFQIEGRAFPSTKRTKGMAEEVMRTILGAS